jgi:hypothetical protein
MERRMAILKTVEPILEGAIKTLNQVIDIRGMMGAMQPPKAAAPTPPPEMEAPEQESVAGPQIDL